MKRRNLVLGLGLFAGGSFSIGTGAFSAARLQGRSANIAVTNDADALLGLVANVDIAGVFEDTHGELRIDLGDDSPGINADSAYQFGAFVSGDDANTSDDTLHQGVGELFDPVVYQDEFDPDTNFKSAFKLINQSSEPITVRLEFDVEYDQGEEQPSFVIQSHDATGERGVLYYPGQIRTTEMNFGPGEAIGVSFAIDATASEIGDSLTGSLTVDAGQAVH